MKITNLLTLAAAVGSFAMLTSCGKSKPMQASTEYTYFGVQHTTGDFNVAGNVKTIVDSIFVSEVKFGSAQKGDLERIVKYEFNNDNQLLKETSYLETSTYVTNYTYKAGKLESSQLEGEYFGLSFEHQGDTLFFYPAEGNMFLVFGIDGSVHEYGEVTPDGIYVYSVKSQFDGEIWKTLVSTTGYNPETGQEETVRSYDNDVVQIANKYGQPVDGRTYDENGDLVQDDGWDGSTKYEYVSYDSHDNWTECIETVNGKSVGYVTTRHIEYR